MIPQKLRISDPITSGNASQHPKGRPSLVFINLIRLTIKVILDYITSSVSKTNQANVLSKRDKLTHRIVILLMEGVRCLKKKVGSIP